MESRTIRDFIHIMSNYDAATRRDTLQFLTGSPKLPIGGMFRLFPVRLPLGIQTDEVSATAGFRGLNPALTIVRKGNEPPLTPDDYLPSVMTCVNVGGVCCVSVPAWSCDSNTMFLSSVPQAARLLEQ
jgi:E3 ubiquitin-protein ligase TRIP12